MTTEPDLLNVPYKELVISSSLKRFFAFHEIPTLEKLLETKQSDLLKMKWFNESLWLELLEFLEENGISKTLK